MIASPWGSRRRSTAWAMASAIHQTPSTVTAIETVRPSLWGRPTVRKNSTGSSATIINRTL